ncbi:hydantoinase/oxoprolinase family protein [Azospirillum canadense]|uniref:hydantoinase/oxoprolinase family protein n=1 Tax=Azospirillum canadense TaxID=403962 RepID=UPI0022277468|nr:hydantoinase/oxoprolinase family protein [Azospirillum canadense]MCW2242021.1 N-methylhydantoinase A [Azospirillum canadense]
MLARDMLIGVDVGGTFTDLVLADGSGGVSFVKSPSTPDDPSRGVVNALVQMAAERGESLERLLGQTRVFIHGTTVATNVLVQRNGARLGLITTRGFRDVLELREGARSNRYDLRAPAPDPLIPRPLRLEVTERVAADGTVLAPLDEAELGEAIATLRAAEVDAVVVSFLHAHKRPDHEAAVRAAIEGTGWRPFVSLGHEVLEREGEYDRLSTAAVNAYVGPALQDYLKRLVGQLKAAGIGVPLFVMQSNGGVLPIEEAGRRAYGAVTSGPAGGAMAGALFARTLGLPNLVTYDTGGTSTDVCVIKDGVPIERNRTDLADFRITAPAIEINPIGIGGGSVARIDASGILAVGPQSAGAVPGPACFGKSGTRATLTDANLVLGLISAETFLGGRMSLSVEAARSAVQADVAGPLGVSVEEAAWAVHILATAGITEGIRLATIRQGLDPRDFALMSFGGAGGLHADAVAQDLQIPTVVVPRMASVLSALGFLAADIRQDLQRFVSRPIRSMTAAELAILFDALEEEGRARLRASGVATDGIRVERSLECRYGRQVHGIPVRVGDSLDDQFDPAALERAFTETYRALYQHAHEGEAGILDVCRLSVYGALPKIDLPTQPAGPSDPAPAWRGRRSAYLGGFRELDVYWFDDLRHGMRISGPAIVESASTTILVGPGRVAAVDGIGNLLLNNG